MVNSGSDTPLPWEVEECSGAITQNGYATQPLSGTAVSAGDVFDHGTKVWFKFKTPISTWELTKRKDLNILWFSVDMDSVVITAAAPTNIGFYSFYFVLTDFDPTDIGFNHSTCPTRSQCILSNSSAQWAWAYDGTPITTPTGQGTHYPSMSVFPLWRSDILQDYVTGSISGGTGMSVPSYLNGSLVLPGANACVSESFAKAEPVGSGIITSYTDATRTYTFDPPLNRDPSGLMLGIFPTIYGLVLPMLGGQDTTPYIGVPSCEVSISNFKNAAINRLYQSNA